MKNTPPGWTLTRIGQVCEVVRGASPRPAGAPRYFDGDYLPWITVAEVTSAYGMHLDKTKSFLTEEGAKFTRTIPPDTLILTNSGATLGVPKITKIKAGANDGIAVLLNPKGVTNEYLYFVLESRTDYFRNHLAPGNGQPNLNTDLIKEESLLLPPVSEQSRITNLGMLWDKSIQNTERLIAAKEVYIGAVTERIYRRSPGWSRYRLGDFLQETKVLHGHGDYVIGSVGKNGIKPRDEVYSKNLTSNHERNLLVKPGWLCFGLASDCMAFGVNSTNQTYSVSPAYRTFQINGADPRFFEGYLRVFNGRLSKRFLITSARQGKAIDFEGLFNTECYFPSREEQQQIASAVLLMREELDHLRQLREALKRQKRGLMQKLLTGKWRIQMEEGVPV